MTDPSHRAAGRRTVLALAVASLAAGACGGGDEPAAGSGGGKTAKVTITDAARKEARTLFDSLCFTCHGKTGHGDGPGAAAMDPKPRTFADKEWQASVTDEHIEKVIVFGGAAVGKSPQMVPNLQLKSKPAVLGALVEIVRGFGK